MDILAIESTVGLLLFVFLLAVKLFCFVNSLLWSNEAYQAAGKLTKPAWATILGVGLALQFVPLLFIFNIAFIIAAFVYLADVRPALANLYRR